MPKLGLLGHAVGLLLFGHLLFGEGLEQFLSRGKGRFKGGASHETLPFQSNKGHAFAAQFVSSRHWGQVLCWGIPRGATHLHEYPQLGWPLPVLAAGC